MMNYFQKKKLAFMSIVNRVKGFVRTVTGVLPLTLANCVDEESIIDYTLYGQSVQEGTPTPETPVEVESVGEKSKNLFSPDVPYEQGFLNASGNGIIKNNDYPNIQVFTIAVKPNTTYSYNGVIMNNTTYTLLNSDMEYLGNYGGNISSKQNITFETTSDTSYVQICSSLANFQKGILYFNEGEQYIEEPYYEGYKIPIKVSGKNLLVLSRDGETFTQNGVTFTINKDKGITMNGTCTVDMPIEVSKDNGFTAGGGTYTLCGCFGGSTSTYYLQSQNGFQDTGKGVIVSTKEDKNIIRLHIKKGAVLDNVTVYPMLLKGNYVGKVPDYEPYHEPITTNIYLDEPLRKEGDYADYVDFENGKVVRNVKGVRLNKCTGTYTWIGKKGVTFNSALDKNYDHRKGLCNRNSRWTANGDEPITMWLGVSSRVIYWIGILDYLGLTTATEMNEWLTNNPTYVFYGTDIPTETPITLPNIPTFKGTSIISADTTIQPSNAEVTYYSNVKE